MTDKLAMTKKEREQLFEQFFLSELTLSGAARYLQHLHKITGEENYRDALLLVVESLMDVKTQRRVFCGSEAA